ncbi:Rossmann-like and DUF2520 domain-containing protein [Fuchsiella alkaliacetigena]|uniref:Rossmann-like and DUF2520 domain-containing protein n=1 Tax=Fuchsiella alkaliacetigena TaxID=957042 RepID=UPI00200A102C|nr:Rossmann-like and DUF2520 domain-containing protein [Fuchsiella alkaliacetigena]MCK8824895.1 DUF2520 domain-containing protein [Fuchsiella alkaliacetigena]
MLILGKQQVVIIGAGAVGQSFAYLLAENDYSILGFVSRSLSSAQAGVELLGGGIATTEYDDFIKEADLILITTPDQVIEGVAQKLFANQLVNKGSCLIHFSGAQTADILTSAAEASLDYGRLSLHPLQSIADIEAGIKKLPESFFTIEGNDLGRKVGQNIIQSLGADYEVISAEAKPLYHAAACVTSNYLVAIMDLALKMNEKVGISREQALKALMPLAEGTLANIKKMGSTEALTGPISRGDIEIIESHLESFKELLPEERELYQVLGTYTTEIAQQKSSINQQEFLALQRILKEE